MLRNLVLLGFCFSAAVWGQRVEVVPVEPWELPVPVDSNTPSFWHDGRFYLFSSAGMPILHSGAEPWSVDEEEYVGLSGGLPQPAWVESVWVGEDGILFGWYHYEAVDVCPGGKLTTPKIGAAISWDGGRTLIDLGIVLDTGVLPNCSAKNGYFAGGHGDFSVIVDREQRYFHFFFTNYSGPVEQQGVAVARMAFEDRFGPRGAVWKYHNGQWDQPGLGGQMTSIFPATTTWEREDADSFWGPSIHWNTYLERYVMLLNRSCCGTGWPQEGTYITFGDVNQPESWRQPERILEGGTWYPHVLGTGDLETSSIAGQSARLFTGNYSEWDLVFHREEEAPTEEAPTVTETSPSALQ